MNVNHGTKAFSRRAMLAALGTAVFGCATNENEPPQTMTAIDVHDETTTSTLPPGYLPEEYAMSFVQEVPLTEPQEPTCRVAVAEDRLALVDFLHDQQAFNRYYYQSPEVAAEDLKRRDKATDKLLDLLGRLTDFAFCHQAQFDVLMVNTGHSQLTTSGNRSQHVVGQAIDIRPWGIDGPSEEPQNTSHEAVRLIDDQDSRYRTQLLGGYLLKYELANIHQLIVCGFSPNINRGAQIPYTDWGPEVADYHWDHMHIGIKP